jgi:hypothetical protein
LLHSTCRQIRNPPTDSWALGLTRPLDSWVLGFLGSSCKGFRVIDRGFILIPTVVFRDVGFGFQIGRAARPILFSARSQKMKSLYDRGVEGWNALQLVQRTAGRQIVDVVPRKAAKCGSPRVLHFTAILWLRLSEAAEATKDESVRVHRECLLWAQLKFFQHARPKRILREFSTQDDFIFIRGTWHRSRI